MAANQRPDGPLTGVMHDISLRHHRLGTHMAAEGHTLHQGSRYTHYQRVEHPWMYTVQEWLADTPLRARAAYAGTAYFAVESALTAAVAAATGETQMALAAVYFASTALLASSIATLSTDTTP